MSYPPPGAGSPPQSYPPPGAGSPPQSYPPPQPFQQAYSYPPPPANSPAPRFRARSLVVTGAVCGVLGLLVGLVSGVGITSARDVLGLFGGSPSVDEALAAELPELVAFVEGELDTPFDAPPEVTALDDAAFEREFFSSGGEEPQSLPEDDYTATVSALGLVDDVDAYEDYYATGFAGSVTGFYDPAAETLWVRGTEWSPLVEVSVVHELVHALQDQEVDLDALTAATHAEDDTYMAFLAMVEGHATAVEEAWIAEQGSDYEDEYYDESDDLYADAPSEPFGDEMSALPYWMGYEAVAALPDTGAAALAAIETPPKTLEQVWNIDDWRAGRPHAADPVEVAEPAAPSGAKVVDRGMVGSYVLALLPVQPTKFVDYTDGPVAGWAGDRYVTWRSDETSCTAVDVVFDKPADADAYVRRIATWDEKGGTVTSDQATVRLTRCTG